MWALNVRRQIWRSFIVKLVIVCLTIFLLLHILAVIFTRNKPLKEQDKTSLRYSAISGDKQIRTVRSQIRLFKGKHIHNSTAAKLGILDNERKCVTLHTYFFSVPICVYDRRVDIHISASLIEHGTWEPNILYVCGSILESNSNLNFLDLGCNLGVYSIYAARFGRKVVSVDPLYTNLELLTESLEKGGLREHVTLLWNAVSNVHQPVTLGTHFGNVGGTFVKTLNNSNTDQSNVEIIPTITLDDLIPFFNESSIFIKMDIETYELKALQGGRTFFETVDVAYILMEWVAHKKSPTGKLIIEFLTGYGLYPHVNSHFNTVLDTDNYHRWPDDVFWIKL